jgi:hypothetical protein
VRSRACRNHSYTATDTPKAWAPAALAAPTPALNNARFGVKSQHVERGGSHAVLRKRRRSHPLRRGRRSGFPLLVIPGGGLNSVEGLATHPFNPFDEFKNEYASSRRICATPRVANQRVRLRSIGRGTPYTDDHIGPMDHLGIRQFMVLGFCIGGPFIWNPLKRTGDRVVAAVPAQPSGYRPEMPDLSYNNNMKGWGPELCTRRPDITTAMVDAFLTNMYRGARADFVYTVTRDFVRNCQTPILVLPDDVPGHPYAVGDGDRASRTERTGEPLSVEGHPGQDPAGGAPHPHLPSGASTCGNSTANGRRRAVAPVHRQCASAAGRLRSGSRLALQIPGALDTLGPAQPDGRTANGRASRNPLGAVTQLVEARQCAAYRNLKPASLIPLRRRPSRRAGPVTLAVDPSPAQGQCRALGGHGQTVLDRRGDGRPPSRATRQAPPR